MARNMAYGQVDIGGLVFVAIHTKSPPSDEATGGDLAKAGNLVVTGSEDSSVLLWDVSALAR